MFQAKNVILSGVRSVTILDNDLVHLSDLSSQVHCVPCFAQILQFFFTEHDIGKKRSQVCLNKLIQLNQYVEVKVANSSLSESLLLQFHVTPMHQLNSS
jgi:molybdopterin/thiamine biosynthesis adenylyltransferase